MDGGQGSLKVAKEEGDAQPGDVRGQRYHAFPWSEPGGDTDLANPLLPVPNTVKVIDEGNAAYWSKRGGGGDVSDQEIDWMIQQRQLSFSSKQLTADYGELEAAAIIQAVESACMPETVAGALAWPGVATRWRRFIGWWRALPQEERPTNARDALAGFAQAVGRVRTFRALALDAAGLQRILKENEIFPSGRLREGVDATAIRDIVEKHGVTKVAVVRLFISHMPKIGGIDPSISLHDDWQTTSLIASGYANASKRVHLFELSVPAIESLGWTLQEVAERSGPFLGPEYAQHEPWFCFPSPAAPKGTWFDATLQRTERYGLFSVPHLRKRLRKLYVFDSTAELSRAVAPFVGAMASRQRTHPVGQVKPATNVDGSSWSILTGTPTIRLLSGEVLDADFRSVTTAASAKSCIAANLQVQESHVRLFRGSAELDGGVLVGDEELGAAIVRPHVHNGRIVQKIMPPGVDESSRYEPEWRIKYEDDVQTSACSESVARELIESFNYRECTKQVEFFWHGHSGKVDCVYYIEEEADFNNA